MRQKEYLHASKDINNFIYRTFTFQGIHIWNTILRDIKIPIKETYIAGLRVISIIGVNMLSITMLNQR